MSANKWYKKVTFQAAILNAIPNIMVAFIAILAMISTCNISNKQIEQNDKLAMDRYKKDSLLVEMQLKLATKELELNKELFYYEREKYNLDSINAEKSLTISNKQLQIEEISKKLDMLTERSNLKKLNDKIWSKLTEFFDNNNPQPQVPLKLGEKRIIKYQSDLMLSHQMQNKWSEELKELLYSGLTNRYLISKEKAYGLWNKELTTSIHIIDATNNFLKEDYSFIDYYDFKKLFNVIWENYNEVNRILFTNSNQE